MTQFTYDVILTTEDMERNTKRDIEISIVMDGNFLISYVVKTPKAPKYLEEENFLCAWFEGHLFLNEKEDDVILIREYVDFENICQTSATEVVGGLNKPSSFEGVVARVYGFKYKEDEA